MPVHDRNVASIPMGETHDHATRAPTHAVEALVEARMFRLVCLILNHRSTSTRTHLHGHDHGKKDPEPVLEKRCTSSTYTCPDCSTRLNLALPHQRGLLMKSRAPKIHKLAKREHCPLSHCSYRGILDEKHFVHDLAQILQDRPGHWALTLFIPRSHSSQLHTETPFSSPSSVHP